MANMTVLDVIKQNNTDPVVGMVEENISAHPEIMMGGARTIPGTTFKSLVRTALPSVGFRNVNEGVATTKATYEQRASSCYLCDASSEVDEEMAQVADDPLELLLANEMDAKIEAYMRSLASQFYYGTASTVGVTSTAASPTKGFVGLADIYDTTNMEVDAAGSSGAYTSVWFVKFGPKYVQWLIGQNGAFSISETSRVRLTDGSDNPYDGLRKSVKFWIGLHCVNPRNSVVRIKKIDTSATLSDSLIDQGLEKFPAGVVPDVCLMTRRTLRQLKSSRTAYNPLGNTPPWPNEIAGIADSRIPIMVTDAISQVETA